MSLAPVSLKINGTEYPLTDCNEKRVKRRLLEKYKPNTVVEEWVMGELSRTATLVDIFNLKPIDDRENKIFAC